MNPVVLIVIDGFGIAPQIPSNPIFVAKPQTYIRLLHSFPSTELEASGTAVGLPENEVGSTEVGHINLGAGHIVYQNLPRINLSVADGSFFKNLSFLKTVSHLRNTSGDLHLLGLFGSGTVHASMDHLYALLAFAKQQNISNVYIHAITDGRDSPPSAALHFLEGASKKINELGVGKIASVIGRFFALDRDKRWHRVEKAYRCLTEGKGAKAKTWTEAIEESYKAGKTDEYVEPTNIVDEAGNPIALIKEGDAVIFYNFRIDRPRELTKAFVLDNFERDANAVSYDPYATKYFKRHEVTVEQFEPPFRRGDKINNLLFVTMTQYEKSLPVDVAFPPHVISYPLGRVLAEHQMSQLRIAESEKERFVTFYFNGLRETAFPMEDRLIIPSPKVHTYSMKPEMSAPEITAELVGHMRKGDHQFYLVNYANPDMVGHTGDFKACVAAVAAIDKCLSKILETALITDHTVLITADHGNVELKIHPQTGAPHTEHTGNPVPFIAIDKRFEGKARKLRRGMLADVAPTILALYGITKPSSMTGRNLLEGLL